MNHETESRTGRRPLVIAHRGASADAPENTLAAFALAFEQGADGVEFDVRLARDGVPVTIHDATLDRTSRRRGLVSDFSSDELAAVDVGSWFASASKGVQRASFADEVIPTLAQVFDLAAPRARALYVEMKFEPQEDYGPLAARVVEGISNFRLEDRAVVESFNLEAVGLVKRIAPNVRTAALFERNLSRPLPSHKRIIEQAVRCGADELALHHSLASPAFVEAARGAGLQSVVWTVDVPSWADRARRLGLRALITNRPARMRARLDSLGEGP